jgi:hypothetical protein
VRRSRKAACSVRHAKEAAMEPWMIAPLIVIPFIFIFLLKSGKKKK